MRLCVLLESALQESKAGALELQQVLIDRFSADRVETTLVRQQDPSSEHKQGELVMLEVKFNVPACEWADRLVILALPKRFQCYEPYNTASGLIAVGSEHALQATMLSDMLVMLANEPPASGSSPFITLWSKKFLPASVSKLHVMQNALTLGLAQKILTAYLEGDDVVYKVKPAEYQVTHTSPKLLLSLMINDKRHLIFRVKAGDAAP